MDKSVVGPALGKLISGLYIVSLKHGETEAGFLASWVQQAGFEPPMITLAFNKERKEQFDLLTKSGKLVLNMMAKENSKTLSAFFKAAPESGSVFDSLETFTDSLDIPILKDSMAYLECKYHSEMESEDHVIVLCEVLNGKLTGPDLQASVHIRPDGFRY